MILKIREIKNTFFVCEFDFPLSQYLSAQS